MSLYFCFIDGTACILQIVSHVLNFLGVKELRSYRSRWSLGEVSLSEAKKAISLEHWV